eukprot:1136938-Pelagomonas_calceolata.AAC.2
MCPQHTPHALNLRPQPGCCAHSGMGPQHRRQPGIHTHTQERKTRSHRTAAQTCKCVCASGVRDEGRIGGCLPVGSSAALWKGAAARMCTNKWSPLCATTVPALQRGCH